MILFASFIAGFLQNSYSDSMLETSFTLQAGQVKDISMLKGKILDFWGLPRWRFKVLMMYQSKAREVRKIL